MDSSEGPPTGIGYTGGNDRDGQALLCAYQRCSSTYATKSGADETTRWTTSPPSHVSRSTTAAPGPAERSRHVAPDASHRSRAARASGVSGSTMRP